MVFHRVHRGFRVYALNGLLIMRHPLPGASLRISNFITSHVYAAIERGLGFVFVGDSEPSKKRAMPAAIKSGLEPGAPPAKKRKGKSLKSLNPVTPKAMTFPETRRLFREARTSSM